jgi:hypothetical protein
MGMVQPVIPVARRKVENSPILSSPFSLNLASEFAISKLPTSVSILLLVTQTRAF